MAITYRLALTFVLLLALFGAGIHYETRYNDRWPYPTPDDLVESYGPSIGEQAIIFGTVREVDPAGRTATIGVEHSNGTLSLTVHSFDILVEPGGTVQVFGTIRSNHTIAAERTVVVNPGNTSKLYKYAVSILGAILVVTVFFRSWRIDPEKLAFERRNNG